MKASDVVRLIEEDGFPVFVALRCTVPPRGVFATTKLITVDSHEVLNSVMGHPLYEEDYDIKNFTERPDMECIIIG